ncbi:DUF5801 repeats-in-toxin domain-containing protein [Bradyrhizobium sp. ISRA464]|uniref:DUF5801 repeats-in-toxin domain-containing protein n=1 Tax=Bradyrhizobium sp. ISRA464 TaxID=2866200 RepID=UPI0024792A26|nr:DUF5801 repeats-in-toxin domain-containing protein [Bradyrhizobium sp. ISRA464]WGS29774.1 DUF5801 domain-containing protein [Bradyrhizobium sp. ISRA464]
MQGQFQVAQAAGTGNSANSAPVRIYKLTKPLTDQAVIVNLGYDQKVQVDFSAIAKEKITLVHIGEKLIILFDNQSTVTVEPFFDSRSDPLSNITVEVAPGRDVSGQEFATLFPISTDASVLPAADNGGNANGNAQASGANFSPFAIDALDPVPTNQLAGPETLPNFTDTQPTGFVLEQTFVAPTIAVNSTVALTLSDANLTATTNNGFNGTAHSAALTSVKGNFAADFTDTAGSTGISSVSYALSIPGNGTPSGLIDSQTQQQDVLVQVNATTIEGHVGIASGALAFTITVDPTTGVVTFTEDRAVNNNGTGATGVSLAAGTVTLTQTVVDNDGGTASASIDLGTKLSITDDRPIVTVVPGSEPSLMLSETHLTAATNNGVDGTAHNLALTSVTHSFAGAFNDNFGADGSGPTALDPHPVVYTLSIGNGGLSGLVDSQSQQNDVLVQTSSNTITGYVGSQASGLVAFTITVDGSGNVTFTEDRAVDNNGTGATGVSFAAGAVTLTQTITDGDGSSASASLDLGAKLSITDDGPTVTVVAANEPSLTLSETHLTTGTNPDSGTAPSLAQTTSTGNFSGAFTDVAGADGIKSTAYSLTINGGSGTASGLVDSHTQLSDVLVQVNATTIEGHVGNAAGALAFTISVDPSTGIVTFTEDRAVDQPQSGSNPSATPALFTAGVLTLTQTVTDNDGTTASAGLDLGAKLSITDDGPTVTVVAANEPTLTLSETHLTTGTNPDSGTAPNLALTTTTGNFSGAFTDVAGADGIKSTAYSLTINGGSGTASGLVDSHTQLSDVLVQVNATTIEGHVGSAAGALAFTISVDPSTGIVTFTEDRGVDQPQSGSNPSATPALFTAGVLTLTQTVTDNDGTVASAGLDLGAKLAITDDGPTVTVVGKAPTLTLSETHLTTGTNPDDGTAPNLALTTTTGNFSGVFADVAGADGIESTAYSLTINGGSGTASGLVDSHTQQNDVLVQVNATTIEGHVGGIGGALAFTISVDPSTGIVTFTEDRAVDQPQSGSNPSATPALFTAGVLTLTQTVTDNDGTVASAGLDLGAKLSITDDGPTVTVVAANEPTLTLSETHLTTGTNPDSGTAPSLALTTTTGNFSAAFADVAGADGIKSTAYTLTVNGGSGTASGLVDSHTQLSDVLVQVNATTIEGHVGNAAGALAFTISVDPSTGIVTFTEDRAVDQPQSGSNPSATPALFTAGVLTLTQTVTDNDGTVASAGLDLGAKLAITDDGPSVTVVAGREPTLTLSETHLTTGTNPDSGTAPNLALTSTTGNFSAAFTDVAGADGIKSTAYSLTINGGSGTASGLVDSHTQLSDVLVQVSATTIEGHVGGIGGPLAFTISVDPSTGIVTFTEDRAVDQPQSGSNPSATPGLFTAGVLTLTQTVTDNDGTVASAGLDLGAKLSITDDGPTVTVVGMAPTLTLSETNLTTGTNPDSGTAPNLALTSTTGNFSGVFADVAGADGIKSTAYSLTINGGSGTASGLVDSHTQQNDVLVQVNATTIEGHVGSAAGALAFTISVDPSTGIVTFTEDRAVDQPQSGSNPSATPALFTAGVLTLMQTVTDNDGTVASAGLDLGAKLAITDDGPSVTVVAGREPSLTLSETHLTTGTNPDSGTAPNLALTTTTGNFSAAFADVAGADGIKSTAYSLTINGGSGTASGLVDSHTQQNDVLVQVNATTIEGHVGGIGGALAFTISVDPATGIVTFTEDRAVDNNLAAASLTAGVLTLTQTVTDNDGTVASAGLDLGAKLSITDDGPTVTVVAANAPSLTLSETHLTTGTNPDSGTAPNLALTTTTGNFSAAFTDVAGADGIKSTAYSLTLNGGNGTASGLVDSHTQQSDVLVQVNATTIEGHVGSAAGALAFTISVDPSTGIVTFTEDRAVDQAQSGSNPSATPALFTAGVLTLTQTVTDNDGTVASAGLDLGAKLAITDDGPTVTVVAGREASLTLSETHLTTGTNPDDGTAPSLALTTTTGNFSAAFTDVAGADGIKSTAYTLTINGGNGTASGLVDSHTQQNDVLVQVNATTIEGHVGGIGGALAFTISVDPSTGIVTFTEDRAVDQPQSGSNPSATPALFTAGVLTLTQTVTDNDGTTASAGLDLGAKLSITDDGPTVTVVAANEPTLTLSETHLTTGTNPDSGTAPNLALTTTTGNFSGAFTDVAGADGIKSTAYSLTINGGSGTASGLVDSHTQLSDVLVQVNATTIEGHVGSAAGALAFTISVDPSTGIVTFTEDRGVDQPQSGSNPSATPALFTAGVLTLTQTVTDNDGTVASAGLDLGAKLAITDDGPTVTVVGKAPTLTLSETHLTTGTNPDDGTAPNLALTTTTGNFSGVFADVAGADGIESTAYSLTINGGSGTASGLVDSHTQQNDVLVQVNATTIEGHVGGIGGALAFTISVDPSTGIVTFTEDRAVDQPQSGSNPSATPALFTAGVLTLTQTVTDNDGTVASAGLDLGAKLSITDDGPTVTVVAANEPTLTLSETHLTTGTNPDSGTAPSLALTTTTGNFSAAFADVAGADGIKSTAYTLTVNGGSGTASGLVDSHTQLSDVLVQVNATTIEGHVGSAAGALAFTISVDPSTGIVTFTEDRAVDQAQSGSNPSATLTLFTAGVLTLTQTVTDNDGTVASAGLDLGAKLAITDDGPTVTVVGKAPTLTLSETNLTTGTNPDDGTAPNLALTTTTGNFSGVFADVAGADGIKSTAYSLTINGGSGTASGLVDSHTQLSDVLVQVSATKIEGHVGGAAGALAFVISVDPSTGIVTFTEDRAVDQAQSGSNPSATPALFTAGVLTLTQTVTDNDGTVASAGLDLGAKLAITDDGPTVTVVAANAPTLTLSETHLTTGTNPDSGTAPSLALTTTTGNFSGAFTDVAGADGIKSTAYSLTINGGSGTASGLVDSHTQQSDVLVQVNATTIEGHVGSAAGALAFVISVDPSTGIVTFTEDRAVDNNLAPASLTAGVLTLTQTVTDNDGTVASAGLDLGTKLSITDDTPHFGEIDTAIITDSAGYSVTGNITFVTGADGFGTPAASLVGNTAPAGLMFDGQAVSYYVDPSNPELLIAYIGTDHTIAADQVFTLSLDPSNDQYTFTLLQPFTESSLLSVTGATSFGSGPAQEQILTSNGNEVAVISGSNSGGAASVNGSTAGWGVDNNNFDPGEKMLFDFTNNAQFTPGGATGFTPVAGTLDANFTFSKSFSFSYVETYGHYVGGTFHVDGTITGTVNNVSSWTSPTLSTALPGYQAGDQMGSLQLSDLSGQSTKVDLTGVDVLTTINVSENLSFTVHTTDGDGSTAAPGTINVDINGGTSLSGTGNEVLAVAPGDTVTLTGNNNTIQFDHPTDGGTLGISVTGFNAATDAISVSAAGFTAGSITFGEVFNNTQVQNSTSNAFTNSSERFLFDSTNHTLYYSPDGTTAHEQALAILNGVTQINATNIHVAH